MSPFGKATGNFGLSFDDNPEELSGKPAGHCSLKTANLISNEKWLVFSYGQYGGPLVRGTNLSDAGQKSAWGDIPIDFPPSPFLANFRFADDSEALLVDQTVGIVPPSMT